MTQTKWLGHEIDENGIKPNKDKVKAILKLDPPDNTKELKSFLVANEYKAKLLPKERKTVEERQDVELGN